MRSSNFSTMIHRTKICHNFVCLKNIKTNTPNICDSSYFIIDCFINSRNDDSAVQYLLLMNSVNNRVESTKNKHSAQQGVQFMKNVSSLSFTVCQKWYSLLSIPLPFYKETVKNCYKRVYTLCEWIINVEKLARILFV